jgi:hypothetical protein
MTSKKVTINKINMRSPLIRYLSTAMSTKKRQMNIFNWIMDELYKRYNIDSKQYNECFNLIVNKNNDYRDSFVSIINMISKIKLFDDDYDKFDVFDDVVDTIIEGQYIHFENLLNDINDKCKGSTYKYNEHLINKYNNDLINKYTVIKNKVMNDFTFDVKLISFPENFIYWNSDDLLYTLSDYFINKHSDSIKTDTSIFCESLYRLLHKHFNYNNEELIQFYFSVSNSYFIQKKREILDIYLEELMIKTWEPNRVYNWCFDNVEKSDFDIIEE